MSSTNKTTNYNLSQFVGTDVPSYLGDYNSDMSKIDKAIGDVANSQGSVEQSVVGLTSDVQGLSTQVSGVSTSVQQLQTSVAQVDSGYKQADTALSQRITANANNIQTNTTAIESINTTIGTEDISEIGDGTIKSAISNINSSLEWINKPYTKIYSNNTVGESPTKITADLSQYNEFMLTIERSDVLYASTIIPKAFIGRFCRAMIDDTHISQIQLATNEFTVWRVMPNEYYYLRVYAR